MSQRQTLLESIATMTADYHVKSTPEHVEKWVRQFDVAVQEAILQELNHVFSKTYFTLKNVETFLSSLLETEKLTGKTPCAFWKTVNFLNIQLGGNSQREMLVIFDRLLKEHCGFGIDECGEGSSVYLYLDDVIFTGNRTRLDLDKWIRLDAPQNAKIHIISIASHKGGRYYAEKSILKSENDAGKNIAMQWWQGIALEDRLSNFDSSDVLRPTLIPDEPLVLEYVKNLKYQPKLRVPGNVGGMSIFSSEQGRHLLEQEFLKAGVRIRQLCPHLNKYQRPLGNMVLETLGFGSMIVTFRNCPNNAPLALWAGDPWYPLFPRKTNTDAAITRTSAKIAKR